MMINYSLLVALLILIVVSSADTELEVKGDSKTALNPKNPNILNQNKGFNRTEGGSNLDSDSENVVSVTKSKDNLGGSGEGIQNGNLESNNSSKELDSKKAPNVPTDQDSAKEGDKKEKADKESVHKETPNEGVLPPARKENFRGEECGLSDKCSAEKNALIACLRVPGNESPDLSLLIQNKGNVPLNVKISAPSFIWLEKTQIQLPGKVNEKVKVSISSGGTDNVIVLTAGNDNCTLDFRDLIAHSSTEEAEHSSLHSTYIKFFKRTPSVIFIILAALLLLALVCTCVVSFRWRHFASNGSKYEKLSMNLPISSGGNTDVEANSGWDNSWGDSWDDEEAPKTPSMPVTPSLSSTRISSRRVNKDGWKD